MTRLTGEVARSGTINAGETFEMRASATAGESTYADIIKMVTAAQTAKSPFIRMADRFALLLLPVTLLVAGGAGVFGRSHSRTRRARRGDTLSSDPRGARGIYRRRRPGRPPQHLDQGWWPARGARPHAHSDVRQDRHFNGWRRAPGCRRDSSRPGSSMNCFASQPHWSRPLIILSQPPSSLPRLGA